MAKENTNQALLQFTIYAITQEIRRCSDKGTQDYLSARMQELSLITDFTKAEFESLYNAANNLHGIYCDVGLLEFSSRDVIYKAALGDLKDQLRDRANG